MKKRFLPDLLQSVRPYTETDPQKCSGSPLAPSALHLHGRNAGVGGQKIGFPQLSILKHCSSKKGSQRATVFQSKYDTHTVWFLQSSRLKHQPLLLGHLRSAPERRDGQRLETKSLCREYQLLLFTSYSIGIRGCMCYQTQ